MLCGHGPGTVVRVLYTLGSYQSFPVNPAPSAGFRIERSPGGLGVVGASRSLLRLEPVCRWGTGSVTQSTYSAEANAVINLNFERW